MIRTVLVLGGIAACVLAVVAGSTLAIVFGGIAVIAGVCVRRDKWRRL